jgi:hypothetical protein
MDLFRPLPITQKGNIYVFTTIDMFSKLLFTVPLPNCDSITVSHALFQLVFLVFVTVLLVTRAANVYLIVLENYVTLGDTLKENVTAYSISFHCLSFLK